MKNYISFFKIFFILIASVIATGCVHDDKYNEPDLNGYQCQDLTATMTIAEVKALHGSTRYVFPENSTAVMEGYVSSTDETGNIYKTIYIQDSPVNPTQGFVIGVNAVSTYAKFPQGSKIYIRLKGLALGTYGGLVQLGIEDEDAKSIGVDAVSRIPEKQIPSAIFKSCTIQEKITPKVLTLQEMATNDKLLGALIQVNNAEFDSKALCGNFAPNGFSVDRQLNDPTISVTSRVVRNSGFASFANQTVPAGKGTFVGIFSKFNASYQLYINKVEDLADMKNFPRKDGLTTNPCALDQTGLTSKTVAEVKQLFSGGPGTSMKITGDFIVKAKVTANDETGNLFKYFYFEDETGGMRINVNKTNLYQDARFKVGQEIYIKLKDLYIGNVSGELQLGQPFNGNLGQISEDLVYKTFFKSSAPVTAVIPTEKKINQFTTADVGKWVKIKDVQFKSTEIGNSYATLTTSNRTLEDCSGNTIVMRTSNRASFAGEEIDDGKGDVYAILSIFNGTYQLWLPKQIQADFDGNRCDGTVPASIIFKDDFQSSLAYNWQIHNKIGPQTWTTSNQGAGNNYYAVMNGANVANEDWLVSKEISLSGFNKYTISYLTDGNGSVQNPIQVLITDNYSGDPSTTTWTTLPGKIDTVLNSFAFETSGRVDINAFANKKIRIAIKYMSAPNASATWEVDNVQIKGMN